MARAGGLSPGALLPPWSPRTGMASHAFRPWPGAAHLVVGDARGRCQMQVPRMLGSLTASLPRATHRCGRRRCCSRWRSIRGREPPSRHTPAPGMCGAPWRRLAFAWRKRTASGPSARCCAESCPGRGAPLRSGSSHAIVIGGGLAGTAAAASLADRGWRITLLERHEALAAEASGTPQGVLYARISGQPTPLSQLVLAGYQYTLRLLRERLPCDAQQWSDCPVLQLAIDERKRSVKQVFGSGLPRELVREVDAAAGEWLGRTAGHPRGSGLPRWWLGAPAGAVPSAGGFARRRAAHGAGGSAVGFRGGAWRVMRAEHCLATAPTVVIAGARDSGRSSRPPICRWALIGDKSPCCVPRRRAARWLP